MAAYDDGNIFAKVLRGEIPAAKIFETDDVVAIMDVMPQSKGHCLLIPKTPSRNLLDASDETLRVAIPHVARLARAAKAAFGADGVTVMQLNEEPAGQTVFHLHIHIVPRYVGVPMARHANEMEDPAVLREQADAIRAALD